jgi:hypothetical protein
VRYKLRHVDFVGDESFPYGQGMTWESVAIDVPDDEVIAQVEAISISGGTPGHGMDFYSIVPVVRVWLLAPETD